MVLRDRKDKLVQQDQVVEQDLKVQLVEQVELVEQVLKDRKDKLVQQDQVVEQDLKVQQVQQVELEEQDLQGANWSKKEQTGATGTSNVYASAMNQYTRTTDTVQFGLVRSTGDVVAYYSDERLKGH